MSPVGTYDETIGSNHRPDNCFRISAAGAVNYLDGYSIELAAKSSAVSWGSKVDWDEDPFDGLKCDSMTVMATEAMDVSICDMFEAEVNQALAGGWGGRSGAVGVTIDDAELEREQCRQARHVDGGCPGCFRRSVLDTLVRR